VGLLPGFLQQLGAGLHDAATSTAPDRAALEQDYELWARTCYRIRTQAGQLDPLVLNPVQRAMGIAERDELQRSGIARLTVLKARRAGISTDQQARCLHQIWSEERFDALTLAHDDETTDALFEITRRAVENFPAEHLPTLGGRQTSEISFPTRDAKFRTGTAGAKNAGRGMTLKRIHGSEYAFWPNLQGVLASLSPALEGVPRNVIVLETTASNFGGQAHQFWKAARRGRGDKDWNGYRALFFPWWECDPVKYRRPLLTPDELGDLSPEEVALVERFGLDHEQIAWRRAKIVEFGQEEFLKEYAEDDDSCWLAEGGSVFDTKTLRLLLLKKPEPIQTFYEGGGRVNVYSHLQPGETAVAGVDTAEGVGGDRSAFVIRAKGGPGVWRLLETFASNRVEPEEFAAILAERARINENAFLVVEKNAHGITVLRRLRDHHSYPLSNLYHRTSLDMGAGTPKLGWVTTGETAGFLVDAARGLVNAAAAGIADIPSEEAIRDAFAVRRDDRGKPRLTGRDTLVAEALAWVGKDGESALPAAEFW
jgi:hypothetical protein